MSTRKFAVIGHPIGHTMSPFIHKRLFELAKTDGDYEIFDISPEELPNKISALNELYGYNITIPHKQAIIPLIDKLDRKAELYGSVNTVKNGEIREGYTTDPDGFLKALHFGGIPLRNNVLILGCGGVARTFAFEAALAGCNTTIAVRPDDLKDVARLAGELNSKILSPSVSTCVIERISGNFDLLVNATPLGMYPNIDTMAVSPEIVNKCKYVFDAVYNPLETKLIKTAKANGATAVGGMSMLVWQAAVSHEIWDGSVYNTDDINQLVEDSAAELKKKFS
ncbi:MAG: shikimate dehydrogenase family protein [Acutalibacteraceae bacterium]